MDKVHEKKILIQIVGVLEAISNETITITEGEKYIFSPRMVKKLTDERCDVRIVNIVEEGCELEDIESIVPKKLKETLFSLKEKTLEILKSYETIENTNWT